MTTDPGAFHAHLDNCAQCRDHPGSLCPEGERLLTGQREPAGGGEGLLTLADCAALRERIPMVLEPLGGAANSEIRETVLRLCGIFIASLETAARHITSLENALDELLYLKDHLKDADPEAYERRKPLAWAEARRLRGKEQKAMTSGAAHPVAMTSGAHPEGTRPVAMTKREIEDWVESLRPGDAVAVHEAPTEYAGMWETGAFLFTGKVAKSGGGYWWIQHEQHPEEGFLLVGKGTGWNAVGRCIRPAEESDGSSHG